MLMMYLATIETSTNQSKFEAIYTKYKNLMFYIANKILKDEADAEDAVHQAFVKIIEVLDKIDAPECPQTRGLIVTIVERKAIDLYRRRNRTIILPIHEENGSISSSSEIETIPEQTHIAQSIAALPAKYRELLLLKYDCGYSEHEIAEIFSMTDSNVKKTIQRAKAKLRQILEEQEGTANANNG